MGVVRRVGGPVVCRGYGTTKQQSVDLVIDSASLILVECQEDEGLVVVKAGVTEEWDEEVLEPLGDEVDVGVVGVVDEVGGDEEPLGEGGGVDVGGEVVEVAVAGCAGGDIRNRVVNDEGVVLPDIVCVWGCGGVQVVWRGEARGGGI